VDSFIDYQTNHAWTWEHQALIRSRTVLSSKKINIRFRQLKSDVLSLDRDKEKLAHDVQVMRRKINEHSANDEIKHAAGGLLDLEFLVQYLVLAYPDKDLSGYSNTLLQLQQLYKNKVLTNEQFNQLKNAYGNYHKALHQSLLQSKTLDILTEQENVMAIASKFYTHTS
jgi:glutamate-ammonia-ligase adenylyltransferase